MYSKRSLGWNIFSTKIKKRYPFEYLDRFNVLVTPVSKVSVSECGIAAGFKVMKLPATICIHKLDHVSGIMYHLSRITYLSICLSIYLSNFLSFCLYIYIQINK